MNSPIPKEAITIKLENYESIFSDFDPRPFAVRGLSDDFLQAMKHATESTQEPFELVFLTPLKDKNESLEEIILKRIKSHIQKHSSALQKNNRESIKEGLLFAIPGIIIMIGASFFSSHENSIGLNFVKIVLEVLGWFISWFGLDKIFYSSHEERKELIFYKTIEKAKLIFGHF